MRSAQRSPTLWRLQIAALAAICATTASAHADIYLMVTNNNNLATKSYDLTTSSNSGSNYLTISDFAGYSIQAAYNTPSTTNPQGQTLELDAKISQSTSSGANELARFRFQLFSSTQTDLANINGTSSGLFTSPGSGTGYLSSSVEVKSYTPGGGSPTLLVTNQATYTGYSPSQSFTDAGTATTGVDGLHKSITAVTIPNLSSAFDLSAIAVDIHGIGSGGNLHFTAGATVALPEPSGVVAAFAGLPCMGMLLSFARRFRGRNSQSATA